MGRWIWTVWVVSERFWSYFGSFGLHSRPFFLPKMCLFTATTSPRLDFFLSLFFFRWRGFKRKAVVGVFLGFHRLSCSSIQLTTVFLKKMCVFRLHLLSQPVLFWREEFGVRWWRLAQLQPEQTVSLFVFNIFCPFTSKSHQPISSNKWIKLIPCGRSTAIYPFGRDKHGAWVIMLVNHVNHVNHVDHVNHVNLLEAIV